MGVTTGIEWTDATWNPWVGCTKVSKGCAHCYAETLVHRKFKRNFGLVVRSKTTFYDPLVWSQMLTRDGHGVVATRLKGLGRPPRVFTCSLSDFFHPGADQWRQEAWRMIRDCKGLTFQILTKRPERIAAQLPTDWERGYPNVWLGTSVESQEFAHRLQTLERVPAVVHFLSAEPLLGPLSISNVVPSGVDWVIVGGESGAGARPMKEEWVRALLKECGSYGPPIPFFFKQWGGVRNKKDHEAALLDGVTYKGMPP